MITNVRRSDALTQSSRGGRPIFWLAVLLLGVVGAAFSVNVFAAADAIGFVGEMRGQWEDRAQHLRLSQSDPVFRGSVIVPVAPYNATFSIRVDLLSGQNRSMSCRLSSCTTPLPLDHTEERPALLIRFWRSLRSIWAERGQRVDVLASG